MTGAPASRVPDGQRALSHGALRDRLATAAKLSYARRTEEVGQRAWDPLTHAQSSFVDLGRGMLDSFALALHVLWTYQQAWAEETFLATARLDASVGKLLGHIGYQPRPGTAAVGLQHFRCKTGTSATLPAGTSVTSAPKDETEQPVTYETLAPLRIEPDLNELRAFLPRSTGTPGTGGGGAGGGGGTGGTGGGGGAGGKGGAPSEQPGEPKATLPGEGLFGRGSVLDALRERIEVARHGPLEERRVARARQDAQKLAALLGKLNLDGNSACSAALDSLCEQLCEAQRVVAEAKPPAGRPVGALSESQEMLSRQLRDLAKRQADAAAALECAMAAVEGEDPAHHAHRMDCMVAFLDALIGLLIQDARDQVVLLRGSEALNRLDRALGSGGGGATGELGFAAPGADSLYLLPVGGRAPPVRPGDWLVVAEDVDAVASDGRPTKERVYREAVRIARVRREVPPGERSELTHVTFRPPLERSYLLDRVVILGNNTLVSEGATVIELGKPSVDGRTIPLSQAPLTWLRDAQRPGGRHARAELLVDGRAWTQVDTLLAAGPDDPVFTVESLPGGGARLRVGDGANGTVLPSAAVLTLRYRVGIGRGGNRAGGRADAPGTPHPAIDITLNPLPFTGGADPEPAALARVLGPATVGAGDRAVSTRDVQALAEVVDGVQRARVFSDLVRRRTLVVVVVGADGMALAPAELQALRAHLLARVPPGVEIRTANRVPVPVTLRALLRVEPKADPVTVLRHARLRLGLDREPGVPPGLLDPTRLDLGDDLALSQVYGALHGIAGLRSALVRALHRADDRAMRSDRVVVSPSELMVWGADVELSYEEAQNL
jgi:hypothetical protein